MGEHMKNSLGRRVAAIITSTAAVSTMAVLGFAAPAQAAGWGTLSTHAVNKSLSYTSMTAMGPKFKLAKGVRYRYCIVVKGTGQVNLQPQGFATVVTPSSTYSTRCTKALVGDGNASLFQAHANLVKRGTTATVRSMSIQRYYTGAVPV